MTDALKTIVPIIGSMLAGWFTYKVNMIRAEAVAKRAEAEAKAKITAAAVAEDQSAVDGWQKLADQHEKEFARLGRQIAALRSEVEDLQSEVTELKRDRDQHRFWRLVGVEYIKTLIATLVEHRIPVPKAPPGLNLET